jgi:elongation factor P
MKTAADARVGDLLLIDKKIFRVEEVETKGSAKAHKTIHLKMNSITDDKHLEHTYNQEDKLEEADVLHKNALFSYEDETFFHFIDEGSYEDYPVPKRLITAYSQFLKENEPYKLELYEGKPINVIFPPRVRLKVTTSPPGIKQHDSTTPKEIILENGMTVDAPQFIEEGDTVEVDTHTGKYIDRIQE